MSDLSLSLSETEARALYRLLHQLPGGQDEFSDAYRQLQLHFFATLTVEEVTRLLEENQ